MENGRSFLSFGQYPAMLRLWIVYLMIFPIYFFPSGTPQIADFYMALVLGVTISMKMLKLPPEFKQINKYYLWFMGYALLANIVLYFVMIGEKSKGLSWYFIMAFYVYNYLVVRFVMLMYSRYRHLFFKATLLGCLLGGLIACGGGQFMEEFNDIRGSLTFQTSNQLGYYSLILAAIFLLIRKAVNVSTFMVLLMLFICFYMAAVSISNAAIGSIIILFTIYFLESGLFSLRNIFFGGMIAVFGSIALFTTSFGQSTLDRYRYRSETSVKDQAGVTEWEYRGYDRMLNHPGYLILGAGEGAYNRFDTFIEDHEMHSSFGTILFCYGIPGFTLFTILMISFFKGLKMGVIIYAAPIFAYGVTHMGLRFTMFWIALALFPVLYNYSKLYWAAYSKSGFR